MKGAVAWRKSVQNGSYSYAKLRPINKLNVNDDENQYATYIIGAH